MRYGPLSSPSPALLGALCLGALTAPARAQTKLYELFGPYPDGLFGQVVDVAGDVDGDGVPDFIVGAEVQAGLVRVYSGATGALVRQHGSVAGEEYLGTSVAGVGDVDGDGFDDYASGGYGELPAPIGRVIVFSGLDGTRIHEFDEPVGAFEFGRSIAGPGDVDGDGRGDIAIGAWSDEPNGEDSGSVRLYSGADGSLLLTLPGESAGDFFGYSLSRVGDVDADGRADLLVGAPQFGNAGTGYVRVYSGQSGAPLLHISGIDPEGAQLGRAVADAGDVDGDGVPDVLTPDPSWPASTGTNRGAAYVVSGRSGQVIRTAYGLEDGDRFGFSVAGFGDLDLDGHADYGIGSPFDDADGQNAGSVRVISGVDGHELYTIFGDDPGDTAGWDCVGLGDLNGDGFPEFCIGLRETNDNQGSVQVISPCPLPIFTYCLTTANSQNFGALMFYSGTSSIGANDLELIVVDAVSDQAGIFFYGQEQIQVPFGNGLRCVGGAGFRLSPAVQLDELGAGSLELDMTAPPLGGGAGEVLPGSRWNFQFWYRDPAAGGAGFDFSDALSATFCP